MSSDEAHTCPICLEPIFQPASSAVDENGNSVGESSSNPYNIGATVPCGHLYHYDCFGSWQASRAHRNRTVKCPTCNVETDSFVRLYLDVGSLGGLQCHLADNDDISLSSIEESKCDEDENDSESIGTREQDPVSDNNDENDENIVDLTESPKRPKSQPLQLSTANNNNDNCDDNKLRRLSRIAKKFKKQYLQKSAQYKEQYTEKRKLSDRIRHAEGELKSTKEQMSEVIADQGAYRLLMNESKLDLVRIRHERDALNDECKGLLSEKRRAEGQLNECHAYYKKELENARANRMSEVQEIMEEHPKVVEENRNLKQILQKLQLQKQQLERQHRSLSRISSSSSTVDANRKGLSKENLRKTDEGHSSARAIQKLMRQMDESDRFPQNTASTKTSAPVAARNPFETAGSLLANPTNASKISSSSRRFTMNTRMYSSSASRMMKASQKAKKPPPGSDASKKRPFIESLSLPSQSKRRKSYSASRRDLFQRKP